MFVPVPMFPVGAGRRLDVRPDHGCLTNHPHPENLDLGIRSMVHLAGSNNSRKRIGDSLDSNSVRGRTRIRVGTPCRKSHNVLGPQQPPHQVICFPAKPPKTGGFWVPGMTCRRFHRLLQEHQTTCRIRGSRWATVSTQGAQRVHMARGAPECTARGQACIGNGLKIDSTCNVSFSPVRLAHLKGRTNPSRSLCGPLGREATRGH